MPSPFMISNTVGTMLSGTNNSILYLTIFIPPLIER